MRPLLALQHTATHCNTLQHTAAHCSTPQNTATHTCGYMSFFCTATHCSSLQHTATHCNTLQHTATHCNTLQHISSAMLLSFKALQYKRLLVALQYTSAHCNTFVFLWCPLPRLFRTRGLFVYRVPTMSRLPHSVWQCVAV